VSEAGFSWIQLEGASYKVIFCYFFYLLIHFLLYYYGRIHARINHKATSTLSGFTLNTIWMLEFVIREEMSEYELQSNVGEEPSWTCVNATSPINKIIRS
jgi:hypothetical protein